MEKAIKILILEHDHNDLELLQYALKKCDLTFVSEVVETREAFTNALQTYCPEIILSDFSLPTFDGLSAFKIKQELCADTPFIIVSGTIGEENAVELIKSGVTDYVLKERLYQIGPKIQRALHEANARRQKVIAEKEVRKKKKQLKQAYQQTKNLLESISEGFFAVDKNWTVTYWNKAAEKLLFTPRERALGSNLWDVFPESLSSKSYTEYNRTLSEQVTVNFIDYFEPLDKWYEITAFPYKGGLTAFFKDVTEIKAAQEKIKNNERRFRALLQNSTDGLTLLGADGIVIERSPSAMKILELDPSEVAGKFRLDLVHPDDLPAIIKACTNVKKYPDLAQSVEYRMHMPGGNYKWIETILNNQLSDPAVKAIVLNFRDITERKTIELALRKSEFILKRGEEIAHLGSWHINLNSGVTYWSDEIFRLLGLLPNEQEPSAELFLSYVHPEDRHIVNAAEEAVKDGTEGVKFNYRVIRKDGIIRYIHSENKLDFDFGTKESFLFGVVLDITDQTLAEKKLRYSELRLKEAQAIGKIGNWEINFQNGISTWSDEIYRMYGLEEGKIIPSDKLFNSFVHPDDRAIVNNKVKESQQLLIGESVNFRFFRTDGELRYGYSEWRFETDNLGNPIAIFGIQQDVTDIKLAELALEESEEKYRSLFQFSPLPMWVFDLETYRFLNVNKAAIRHYGYSFEEFLAMTIKDIRPQLTIETLEETVESNKKSGLYFQGIFNHEKKNGEQILVDIQSNMIDYEGRDARLVLARDISERQRYIQAIEDQNKKLREIAWLQSHVIRAPLARIMGLIALLKNNNKAGSSTPELLDHLVNSANELDIVIKDIVKETENIEKTA